MSILQASGTKKEKQNREQSSEILPGLSPQDQRWLQDPGSPQLCGALKRHRIAWILPDLLQSLTWICLAETESLYLQMAKPQPSLGFAGKQTSLPGVWKAESSNYNDWLLTQIEVSLAHSLPVGMERTLNQKASPGPTERTSLATELWHSMFNWHFQMCNAAAIGKHLMPNHYLRTTRRQGTLSTRIMFRERTYLVVAVFQNKHKVHSSKLPENFESNPEATLLNVPVIPWTSS